MYNPSKNFDKNFNNPKLRASFESTTGLPVKGNEASFIGFVSCVTIDMTANALEETYSLMQSLEKKMK